MMYDMMGWNTDCRYKILGHKITHEDETMYIFDLLETEIFMDTKRQKKEAGKRENMYYFGRDDRTGFCLPISSETAV